MANKREISQLTLFSMWINETYDKSEDDFLSRSLLSMLRANKALENADFETVRQQIYDVAINFNKHKIDETKLVISSQKPSASLINLVEDVYLNGKDLL